ncbi:MAG TPA: hypothetical protein VMR25_14740, partial [Planctomycetaceae bacterium]|nr:hypothetical protein [Planctomycetaceae bacterium]
VEADIEKVGPACDIYSLGIIFYELLTGEVPYRGSIASVLGQIVTVAPRKPSAIVPKVEPALEAICLKMIAKRPEDRFASMREVAAALESHLAGRPTGITVPENDRTVRDSHSTRIERHSGRGIVIAPWMLWTALAIIIAGFGVTWQLIAMMMKQQAGSGEIAIDQSTKDAFSRGEAHLWLNDKQLTREQLQKPIELPAGSNNVQIRKGAEIKLPEVIVSEKEDPTLLERTPDGRLIYTPLQRRVAESILSQGGKLKLVGSDMTVARAPDLPQGRIRIEGIDLGGVASIPAEEIELIKKLAASLKRLVLPKTGVSERQLDELRKALPDREIKRASETP